MKRISTIPFPLVGFLIIICCLAGCNSGDTTTSTKSAPPYKPDALPMVSQGTAPGAAQPPMSPDNPAMEEPLNAIPIKDAKASYDKAKKAHLAALKDVKATKAYIEATNTFADSTMMSGGQPNVIYPGALNLYREVLKTDSNNRHAKLEIQQMVEIYESLGKPVPGGK